MNKLFLTLFFAFSIALQSGNQEEKLIYAFKTGSINPIKMVLIGETMDIEKASIFETNLSNNSMNVDTRPDTVTVKVLYNPGLRPGQILYLIEKVPDHDSFKDGNIVGEIKVTSIFDTSFFGQRLRAEGHLRLIENKPMVVAFPIGKEKLNEAIIVKKQADYFIHKNDIPQALFHYKKSIRLDPYYPSARYALAKLYSKEKSYVSAFMEYKQTWKNRNKFTEENEKFAFYTDYINFLNYKFQLEKGSIQLETTQNRLKELETVLSVYEEAKLIHPSDYELNLAITQSYYLLYNVAQDLLQGTEKRNFYDKHFENALDRLEFLLISPKNDYRLYRIASILYNDKLQTVRGSDKREAYSFIRAKLKKFINLYLTYKPATHKVDPIILSILEN